MENNELIKEFTDKVIKADDSSGDSVRQIIINKTKNLFQTWKKQKMFEGVMDTGPIQFNGDDVTVNGKVVGHLRYDLMEEDGGVNFISEDGKYSKEFEGIEDLYSFIMQRFGVKENRMEDLGTSIETPKKVDFEGKENLAKLPGQEGADPDGKKEGDKKSQTKGEFNPEGTSADGATSKYSKLKSLISDIKAGKRRTSSSSTGTKTDATSSKGEMDRSSGGSPTDPEKVFGKSTKPEKVYENKANWKLDNKDADGDGKVGKLKGAAKAIRKKADKQGND